MNTVCFFLMTPLNLIYFLSIDTFFIIYVICSNLGALCNYSTKIENLIDEYVFQKFFQMNRVQVVRINASNGNTNMVSSESK